MVWNISPFESGWIFHAKLGWFYTSTDTGNSIWLWHKELGWVWTSAHTFPYLFSFNRKCWLYLEIENSNFNEQQIFDYCLESWNSYSNKF